MRTEIVRALSTFGCVLALATPAGAEEKVGVVTTVIGPVSVARASLPPEPLKFKDDVFIHDRVTTGEDAITRILLGGKVIVTARERSTLTITEVPGLSTINLTSGRIAVAVEKSKMNPGERVDIRTPNAVAGVRGTVLIVEAFPDTSTVTVLRGLVHVTRLNSTTGLPIGGFTAVGARQAVTVKANVLPPRARPITGTRATELAREFTPPLKAVTSTAAVVPADAPKQSVEVAKVDSAAPAPSNPVSEASGGTARPTAVGTSTSGSVSSATGSVAATTSAGAVTPATAGTAPAAMPTAPTLAAPTTAPTPTAVASTPATTIVAAPVSGKTKPSHDALLRTSSPVKGKGSSN